MTQTTMTRVLIPLGLLCISALVFYTSRFSYTTTPVIEITQTTTEKADFTTPRNKKFELYRRRLDPRCSIEESTLSARDAHWHTVQQDDTYVYAAHLDLRVRPNGTSEVVVLGAVKRDTRDTTQYFCQFWLEGRLQASVPGEMSIQDRLMWPIVMADIACRLRVPPDHLPEGLGVSLVKSKCQQPNHLLLLNQHRGTLQRGYVRNFTVCLWGGAHSFSNPLHVIEWFELNKLLGAQKFLLYNISVSCPKINRILSKYRSDDILDILEWNVPQNFTNKMAHSNFQLALIGDCQYRNLHDSRYIVGVDMDELLVPRGEGARTWTDIIENATSSSCKDPSAYAMHHMYFDSSPRITKDPDCRSFNGCSNCACLDAESCSAESFLKVPCQTRRSLEYFKIGKRSKYIAVSKNVGRMRVHRTISKIPGCPVDMDNGGMHHYREIPLMQFRNSDSSPSVYDDRMKNIAQGAEKSIQSVCQETR